MRLHVLLMKFQSVRTLTLLHTYNRRWRGMKPLRAHGAWWIIILLYSQVAHTSMSILNCPRVRGSNQSITAVSLSFIH